MEHPDPTLRFAFEGRVDTGETKHVGHGEGDRLAITPITGGTVTGPRLNGSVVACGGDWSVTRGDVNELDARYLLRTDAPAHEWLAETVFVGMARDEDEQVCIRFYEVL